MLDIPSISAKTTYTLKGDTFLNYDELHITIGGTYPRCVTFPSANMTNQRMCWLNWVGGSPFVLNIGYFEVTIASNVITLSPYTTQQESDGLFSNGQAATFNNVKIYGRKYGA